MRKRERDELSAAARRRLRDLSVELADVSTEPPPPGPGNRPPAPVVPRPGPRQAPRPIPRPAPAAEDDRDPGHRSFFERAEPVPAGPPAGLLAEGTLIQTPVGRPLAPEPARVPHPGRHAVGRGQTTPGEWVEQRLPPGLRGRLTLSGQHLMVLSAVLGVALVLAGWLALRSGSVGEDVPQARFVAQRTDPSGSSGAPSAAASPGIAATSDATGASGAPVSTGGDVVVDVVGKVRRPGIVTLPAGSRVNDAVRRAGGLRAGARTETLNLARVLVDGEQIVVGDQAQAAAAAVAGAAVGPSSGASAASGGLVNINTAGLSELDELPGVGPVTAQKILDWRTAHGAFTSVEELLEVDGIGDKTLADIAPRATL